MTGRRASVVAIVLAVAALSSGVAFLMLRDPHPTSARLGRDGARTFDGVPDDLPAAIVPADAIEIEGTAAGTADGWTAAVTFVVPGTERESVRAYVDAVLSSDGYVFRQRAFDEVSLQETYDGLDGAVVSVSYERTDAGTGTAIVLQGRRDGT